MELVYLWVEKYNNIKEQGFNFSPRFECKFYDEYEKDENGKDRLKDNCQLEIIEKKEDEYIKDFFGKNINVTAIVGKNGSGKSSVAECIAFNHFSKLHNDKSIILLYYDKVNNLFLIYSEKIKNIKLEKRYLPLDKKFNYKNGDDKNKKDHLFKIFYTSGKTWFDPRNERNQKDNIIYEIDISDYTLFEWYAQQIQDEYKHKLTSFIQIWFFSRTQNILNGLKLFKSNIKLPKDLVKPKNVYLSISSSFIKNKRAFFIQKKFGKEYNGFFKKFCWLANNPYNQKIKEKNYILKHLLIQNIMYIEELEETFFEKLNIDMDFDIQVNNKSLEWHQIQIDKVWKYLLENIDGLEELNINRFIELLSQKEKFNLINDANEVDEIVRLYMKILNYGKVDFLELRYEPFLSSGGEQFVNLLSKIYIQIEKNNKVKNNKFILLVVDEPDIYLHPQWQKQFIQILIDFFQENYKSIRFHIIFTTHSPFLLSDIPKQNIIFLDKDEKGNCKVVDGLKEKKQTFGANIHTLLSDSFFMENGLMGEFAKGKIDEVIEYLNGKKDTDIKNDDEAQKLVNIIGEPIVKNQLQRMLDSKRLSKIDFINEKIKNMSYELEILKEYQSKIVKDELRDKGKKRYKERFVDDKNR